MKNRKGFTLIEAVAAMATVTLLTAIGYGKYQKFMAANELRQIATNVYLELRNLHQIARQYDAEVFVTFTTNSCAIYADTNDNGSIDANELLKTITLPSSVTFAVAVDGPTTKPSEINSIADMTGNWGAQITVNNDAVSTTNDGAVYMSSKRMSVTTYCIGQASPMLTVKQYKWEGSKWSNL
jgi:type II secretory pathway pseudopilin PulG